MVQMNGKNSRNKPEPASKTLPSEEKGVLEENGVWACTVCDTRFSDSSDLTSHSSSLHAESHPAECRLCFGRFANDTELGAHIKVKHIQGISLSSAVAASVVTRNNNNYTFNNNNNNNNNHPPPTISGKVSGAAGAHRKPGRKGRGKPRSRRRRFIHSNTTRNNSNSVAVDPLASSNSNSGSTINISSDSATSTSSKSSTSGVIPASLPSSARTKTPGPGPGDPVPKNHCKICVRDFDSYYDWREHAVYEHIFTKNPYPIVEMNYVMVTLLNNSIQAQNPSKSSCSSSSSSNSHKNNNNYNSNSKIPVKTESSLEESESSITTTTTPPPPPYVNTICIDITSSGQDFSGPIIKSQSQEKLRLTICKNKGRNYVVKKSSVSDESEFADENSNTSMTVGDIKVHSVSQSPPTSGNPVPIVNTSLSTPTITADHQRSNSPSGPHLNASSNPNTPNSTSNSNSSSSAIVSNSIISPNNSNSCESKITQASNILTIPESTGSILEQRLKRSLRKPSNGPKSDSSSECGDKENMPSSDSDIELRGGLVGGERDRERDHRDREQLLLQQSASISASFRSLDKYPGLTIEPAPTVPTLQSQPPLPLPTALPLPPPPPLLQQPPPPSSLSQLAFQSSSATTSSSTLTNKKSPASGTVVYLGSSASESERALANAGNSKMVIIQNDILHIGDDAAAEDLQRLTTSGSCHFTSSTNAMSIPTTITHRPQLHLKIQLQRNSVSRKSSSNENSPDGAPVSHGGAKTSHVFNFASMASLDPHTTEECILPTPTEEPSVSDMISEHINNLTKDMVEFEPSPGVGENASVSTLDMDEAFDSSETSQNKENTITLVSVCPSTITAQSQQSTAQENLQHPSPRSPPPPSYSPLHVNGDPERDPGETELHSPSSNNNDSSGQIQSQNSASEFNSSSSSNNNNISPHRSTSSSSVKSSSAKIENNGNSQSNSLMDNNSDSDSGLIIHLTEGTGFEDVSEDEADTTPSSRDKVEASKSGGADSASVSASTATSSSSSNNNNSNNNKIGSSNNTNSSPSASKTTAELGSSSEGEVVTGDAPENDSDDFQCRVCGKNFLSDDEVADHFSSEHFRASSNILEPESPAPSLIQRGMYLEEDDEEEETHMSHLLIRANPGSGSSAGSSTGSGGMMTSGPNIPRPSPLHPHQALAHLSRMEAQHGLSMRTTLPTNVSPASNSMRPPLSSAPSSYEMHQQQNSRGNFTAAPSGRPPLTVGPHIGQRYGPSSHIQPQITPYPTSLHMALTNPNHHRASQQVHQNAQQQQQQQQQQQHVQQQQAQQLHQQHLQHLQQLQHQQQQSAMIRNAHETDGPRIVDVTSMHIPHQIRPIPNPAAVHLPYLQNPNEPVSPNMTLAHQQPRQMPPPTLTRMYPQQQVHQQPQQQQIQSDPLLRLSRTSVSNQPQQQHQSRTGPTPQLILGKRTASTELAENLAKQARYESGRNESIQHAHAQNFNGLHILHGQFNHPSSSSSGRSRQVSMAHSSHSQSVSPASLSPNVAHIPSSPELPPLDRNVSASLGSVGSSGVSSVRLGNAITLSVCPSSESQQQQQRGPGSSTPSITSGVGGSRSSMVQQQLQQHKIHYTVSSSNVTNALAVRGVTVTPASPPEHPHHRTSGSPHISTTPCSSPTTGGAYSVIHRIDRTPNSISPVRNFSPPVPNAPTVGSSHISQHQFAVPRIPAPRATSNGMGMPAPAPAHQQHPSSVLERPHRPPTVDLTDDDLMQHAMETQGRPNGHLSLAMHRASASAAAAAETNRQIQRAQHQAVVAAAASQNNPNYRSAPRPVLTCNQCNHPFSSVQALEDHKISIHGYGHRTTPHVSKVPPPQIIRPSAEPVRQQVRHPPPPQLQQMRAPSPSRVGERNSKNLYIPILDLSRMDPNKLRRLEEMGISCVVPLTGNERSVGHMGIPVMSLRQDGLLNPFPWDNVLPLGPVHSSAQYAAASAAVAAGHGGVNPPISTHGSRMPSPHQ